MGGRAVKPSGGSSLVGNSKEDVEFITLAYPRDVVGNVHFTVYRAGNTEC